MDLDNYRLSMSSLRSVIESITLSAYMKVKSEEASKSSVKSSNNPDSAPPSVKSSNKSDSGPPFVKSSNKTDSGPPSVKSSNKSSSHSLYSKKAKELNPLPEEPVFKKEKTDDLVSGFPRANKLGLRVKSTLPAVPGTFFIHRLSPIPVRFVLESKKPVRMSELSVWVHTNLYHFDNFSGEYTASKLDYAEGSRTWLDDGKTFYTFCKVIYPTAEGEYKLTFYIKYQEFIIWANVVGIDSEVFVTGEKKLNEWSENSEISQITPSLYIASEGALKNNKNFHFDKCVDWVSYYDAVGKEFDAVFSLDDNIQIRMEDDATFICLGFLKGADGALTKIQVEVMVAALRKLCDTHDRVLCVSHSGIGRVGQAIVAYIYANNISLKFEDVLDFVRQRRMVYCHKDLEAVLKELYPRN